MAVALPERAIKVNYKGYKALRVNIGSDKAVIAKLLQLAAYMLNPGTTGPVDIIVAPNIISAFKELNVSSTVLNKDVSASIAAKGELS